jgi:tRNA(Ile)-lysidine synthase
MGLRVKVPCMPALGPRAVLSYPHTSVNSLTDIVGATIEARGLLSQGQGVVVAVSGGLDSMVLLECLHRLSGKHGWKLLVAHFNHQLRGKESDGDEELVRQTATRLNLAFAGGHGDVRLRMSQDGTSMEMAARALRQEFLADTARRHKIKTIALAHHADDQAELFFLRLFRGSGLGLGGMKWAGPSPERAELRLVRPFLATRKADLERFALAEGIVHREDSSNAAHEILRNRVRLELLPLLERDFDAGVREAINRSMEIIGTDTDFAAAAARTWLKSRRRAYGKLHPSVQRHVVRLQLIGLDITPDFALIEQLRRNPQQAISADEQGVVYRDDCGRIHRRQPPADFNDATVALVLASAPARTAFGRLVIQAEIGAGRPAKRSEPPERCEYFDAAKVGERVELRYWRPGDRFQPIGMGSAVKLQDLFVNAKVPRNRRRELVVALAGDGGIFWVEGLRIGERYKITPGTLATLKWTWTAAAPRIRPK